MDLDQNQRHQQITMLQMETNLEHQVTFCFWSFYLEWNINILVIFTGVSLYLCAYCLISFHLLLWFQIVFIVICHRYSYSINIISICFIVVVAWLFKTTWFIVGAIFSSLKAKSNKQIKYVYIKNQPWENNHAGW